MKDKFDKRNYLHFEKDKKHYRFYTDLFTYSYGENEGPVNINKPNVVALYLDLADKAFDRAKEMYNKSIIPNLKFDQKNELFEIDLNNSDKIAFDFIENIIEATILYYTSIEAFVNSLITTKLKLNVIKNGEPK